MTESIRRGEPPRNFTTSAESSAKTATADVQALAERLARYEAVQGHPGLDDRERLLLQAYLHFEGLHGAPAGLPGVCWPTDKELATYLGRASVTAQRGRKRLANPGNGVAPLIDMRRVMPLGLLPNGERSPHGAIVVTIHELAPHGPNAAALQDANAEVIALERKLEEARERAETLASGAVKKGRVASSHNAPSLITPDRSARSLLRVLTAARGFRGGERGCILR